MERNFEIEHAWKFVLIASILQATAATITWDKNPSGHPSVLTPNPKEDVPSGALGITIEASLSAGPASNKPYKITNQDPDNFFFIDANNVLHLNTGNSFDYENKPEYVLTLKATDNSSPKETSEVTCTLSISDVNEPPAFTDQGYSFGLTSGDGENTFVGNVTATDGDSSATGNVVTYSITDGNDGNMFDVNSDDGIITVGAGKTVSSSTASAYILTLTATSSGSGSPSSTAIVRIAVCPKSAGSSLTNHPLDTLLQVLVASSVTIVLNNILTIL